MKSFFIILVLVLSSCSTKQVDKKSKSKIPWTIFADRSKESGYKMRGGTTTGTPVTHYNDSIDTWKRLQKDKLSSFQKDRMAILSMAGDYQTTFEFLETQSYAKDRPLDPPYASWGTEMVRVIQNKKDFISLQHIIVMEFVDPKTGKVQGPFVMKHWRQDWKYEGRDYVEYQGNNTWKLVKTDRRNRKGKWTWQVYQVDDSPRYSGMGEWQHLKGLSIFKAPNLKRPLPRRERTLRNDYDILFGEDTLLLSENGWHHEQRNMKLKGTKLQSSSVFAREMGINKYRRITGFPFVKGEEYWQKTKDYWLTVSKVWNKLFRLNNTIRMRTLYGDSPLFAKHFQAADTNNSKSLEKEIETLIKSYIQK
jgi:hypothetical protein